MSSPTGRPPITPDPSAPAGYGPPEATRQAHARLVRALATLVGDPASSRDGGQPPSEEIRGAVCEYVRALKAAGDPPERVVVAVKAVAAEAAEQDRARSGTPELMGRLVTWCIKEYYRGA